MKKMTGSKSAKATKEIALTAVLSAAYAAAIMLIIIPSPLGVIPRLVISWFLLQLCFLGTELEVPSV